MTSQLSQKRQLEYQQAEYILSNIAAQDIDLNTLADTDPAAYKQILQLKVNKFCEETKLRNEEANEASVTFGQVDNLQDAHFNKILLDMGIIDINKKLAMFN